MNPDDHQHVLIAGGGVAALEAALALRALAGDRVSVDLLAPEPRFWYRPMSVAEPFRLGKTESFDLTRLANEAGAGFIPGELVSVDAARRLAYTAHSGTVEYGALLLACGALPKPAVDGALTFRGPADIALVEQLLGEIEAGEVRRVAFVVPAGATWSLPAYELALMTASWLATHGIDGVELVLVTPEGEPLQLFGSEASAAVRGLLDEREIAVHVRAYATEARGGELILISGDVLAADRVLALPRLHGPRIGGIPQTFEGFVSVDSHGRVVGVPDVYAAGDITAFPIKQGGIAAQQAEAAAEAIAAAAGAGLTPRPFTPVLRGLLLTGAEPRYLRGELVGDAGMAFEDSTEPLWWPPAKIVGRYLAPFLARLTQTPAEPAEPPADAGVAVEVELEPAAVVERRDQLLRTALDAEPGTEAARVDEIMATDLLLVAPEDTLGEVAELMRERDLGSALVVDHGQLIGILTSRDMLRVLAGRVHPSDARARQWMTAEPIAVSRDTTLHAAGVLMTEHGIHHLPVVESERPVGMIGMRDVARSRRVRVGIGLGF
jgi:sulfide:quinone oxidoreductase